MSITLTPIDEQAALDASRILAELSVAPTEPSVLRIASEILPPVTDSVRRAVADPGAEDDDLLALTIAVGVLN
ncbi:hypothetical protein QIS99_28810 [Streptomyces sp. B-S-A8]|uniref:Uncharacterized protein n=1 Tax=Streptomyces solicavernae TaxID=3043614 RepID=A0ABT6S0F2_9ACTN|nr:hypothetical protein [Streptomyces sp. B-S-A8]MDI3390162.1 hypothetical protein [Streptomyces sp. B-S-A8]